MKHVSGLDERHIESPAVIGAEGPVDADQACSSLRSARSCSKPGIRNCRTRIECLRSGAADQERLCARSAEETGGLEVEEQRV